MDAKRFDSDLFLTEELPMNDPMNWNPVAEAAPNFLVDVSTGVTRLVLG